MKKLRSDNRQNNQLREITIKTNVNRYAEGSCQISQGNTVVLCTATVEEKVPRHIKDKNNGSGWLTAEYAMLPRSTHTRSERERNKINARASEISRLIGRSLRAMINLSAIGERTITIDCDVLQADAGTRCASISGGAIALELAINKLIKNKIIIINPIIARVAAVSVAYQDGEILLDPDYGEDSSCDLDLNLVENSQAGIIELQATTEGGAPNISTLSKMIECGEKGISEILVKMENAINPDFPLETD